MAGASYISYENYNATDAPECLWRVVVQASHHESPMTVWTFANWFSNEDDMRNYCNFRVLRGDMVVSIHRYRMVQGEET